MLRRATLAELAEDPAGRFVAGDNHLHFCAAPALWGVVLWGEPDADAVQALTRSLLLELAPPARPHVSLVDASRVRRVDAGAFQTLQRYVRANAARLAAHVTRLGIVRPEGLEGAAVAGFFSVEAPPYPAEVFAARRDALAWLAAGSGGVEPEAVDAALDGAREEVDGTPRLLGDLGAYLEARLADGPTVEGAARALATSERTLQRRLAAAGTTFSGQLAAARVRGAQRLLVTSDAPLTAIALEVGCASLQHLGALFRRHVGMSPSAWRSRRRAT